MAGSSAPMWARGHWWNIKLAEPWGDVASDDLTLDEVERLETLTGVAWANLNPLAGLKQAKAWLLVAAMHAGASADEAAALVEGLNLKGIKGAFQLHDGDAPPRLELVPGVDDPDDEVPDVPPSSGSTSVAG